MASKGDSATLLGNLRQQHIVCAVVKLLLKRDIQPRHIDLFVGVLPMYPM